MTSIAHPSNVTVQHQGVTRMQRAAAALRGFYQAWQQARRQDASAQATHAAALQEARTMAALARSMNGIAVDDERRYY